MLRRWGVGGRAPEELEPARFSFAEHLPEWTQGGGFATGRIFVGGGELELAVATAFEKICTLSPTRRGSGVTFYRPAGLPEGFSVLGHYCQPNSRPFHGHLLVAKAAAGTPESPPPLRPPHDYELVCAFRADGGVGDDGKSCRGYGRSDAYFWLPVPPEGYRALGLLVTAEPDKPPLREVACARADLTDECEPHGSLLCLQLVGPPACWSSSSLPAAFAVRGIRPVHRGMSGRGIGAGTFCCGAVGCSPREQGMACLKNVELDLSAMPTLEQAHAVIRHYGPTLFFHPKEVYLPSSVSWFFKNGAALCKKGEDAAVELDGEGSSLPCGECNDEEYWIGLPDGKRAESIIYGDIDSAELYAHVKPAMGGTCTDVAMWVFCPFNGPARFKLGPITVPLGKTGQHIGDWEHFTLRVSNFTGELMAVYFSQHSGGRWVDASALEYTAGNKPAVYSSRNGHACYPFPGVYLQGSAALGIGIRNDAARSALSVDSSAKYRIVAAEYLGEGAVDEPRWLHFMREWGPTVVYKSRQRMERMTSGMHRRLRSPAERMLNKLPNELSREAGPTGPKEKNNWEGDERW
ncbi:hypothetical protein E2562_001519 [Oryza meyeriana var. granulata]|uniref:Uncharacterized protein n=1 Tax=Oryza meyeriana var. granulata TaxID=110450 RepID=A0A6G1DD71_9ORYZ|nr:hypothetical protein E2562_001519 [Oryza meyeriana var. granulata]